MEGAPMRIECVNGASLIVTHANIDVVPHPWPHGIAFNSRWAHLPPICFTHRRFESISPVYLSTAPSAHLRPLDRNTLNSDVWARNPKS